MPDETRSWRTHNLGRLMFSATDVLVREKLRTMHARGFGIMTEAHMALVQNLDLHGSRLTTIAARASMTKQSMLELVDKLEALGLIERRDDPDDRRARIIAFTPNGLDMLRAVRTGVAAAERRMVSVVGAAFMATLKERLGAYAAAQGPATDGLRMSGGRNDVWRDRSVNRALLRASGAFARDVLRVVHQGGFDMVSEVHLSLFRNLDLGGTRLTEIASRARMTKQAMAELVDNAERLGFVTRQPDQRDARAKLIVVTTAGVELLDQHRSGVEFAEQQFVTITGEAFTADLRAQLMAYLAKADSALAEPMQLRTRRS